MTDTGIHPYPLTPLSPWRPGHDFSLDLAHDLALLSAAAYEPMPSVYGANVTILEVPGLDVRAVITRFDDHTVIAFRGTVDLENWLLNLDVLKAPVAYGVKVHAGFLRAVDALLPGILAELLPPGTVKAAVKPLYVTGHSLGGAVASLAAFFFLREELPVAAVYTFGSPRAGNAAWRKEYTAELGERTYRLVAAGDLVPLLPGLLDAYRHVGQEVMLTSKGIFAQPPHWWEILQDSGRVLWALEKLQPADIIKFHSINRDYLPLLTPS